MTYDISTVDVAGERRLARVAAVCERYGVRAQYSVFECQLDGILVQRLMSELADAIDPRQDSVHIYQLGSPVERARQSLGQSGIDWKRRWVL